MPLAISGVWSGPGPFWNLLRKEARPAIWQGFRPCVDGGQNGLQFRLLASHPPISSSCHLNMSQAHSSVPNASGPTGLSTARLLAYEVALARMLETRESFEQVQDKAGALAWMWNNLGTMVCHPWP